MRSRAAPARYDLAPVRRARSCRRRSPGPRHPTITLRVYAHAIRSAEALAVDIFAEAVEVLFVERIIRSTVPIRDQTGPAVMHL
jgi:hypothetical protein